MNPALNPALDSARALSVAPMMEWTDRWCRRFHRVLSRRALLFTEMVTDHALTRGDPERLIGWSPEHEGAVALQLGGSDAARLATAARIGADFGYPEINLNVGCPSDRVQEGRFGACLMREPDLVADCVAAIGAASAAPVTVKCRIGVDDQDPREVLPAFVETVAAAGCRVFYVHARKAWLSGLSPKDNRSVPPLDYGLVRALKRARPDLQIILNGGLTTLAQAEAARRAPQVGEAEADEADLDGVMLGRAAYQTPALLGDVDADVFGEAGRVSPHDAIEPMRALIGDGLAAQVRLHAMTRHMLGLFAGQPGARAWRRILSQEGVRPGAGLEVLNAAYAAVAERRLQAQIHDEDAARDAAAPV